MPTRVSYLLLVAASVFGCARDQAGPAEITPPVMTGTLGVSITGLPVGSSGSVRVTGPSFYTVNLSATRTLSDLEPGLYQVFGNEVFTSTASYLTNPGIQSVTVVADSTSRVEMHYVATLASVRISVTGLPEEVQPILYLVGSDGLAQQLQGTSFSLQQLVPGPYVLQSDDITYLEDFYASPSDISFTLAGGSGPLVVVPYRRLTSHLEVTITGLPEGLPASVVVSDSFGFARSVTTSDTLRGLISRVYTVTAADVLSPGGELYRPSPTVELFAITPRLTGTSLIAYERSP